MITTYEYIKPFVLELGRVGLLAVIPVIIISLESGEFDWRLVAFTGLLAVLRAVDRMLHKTGLAEKGLTRF